MKAPGEYQRDWVEDARNIEIQHFESYTKVLINPTEKQFNRKHLQLRGNMP